MLEELEERVSQRLRRRQQADQRRHETAWTGLGSSGLVGWSIVVPTLLGILLGTTIDRHFPSRYSWTLMLMVGGLLLGCAQAWTWTERERRKAIREDEP